MRVMRKNEWRSLVRQMVATGLDIAGYGGLGITDRGRALLHGEGAFLYREDTVIVRRPAAAREPRPGRGEDWAEQPMVDGEAALLAVLKALRLGLARERGVPAYVVFPDRTLIDMVRRRPRSEAEFAAVNGVGAAKLKQFAGPFLAAIEAALADTGDGGKGGRSGGSRPPAGGLQALGRRDGRRRRRLALSGEDVEHDVGAAGTAVERFGTGRLDRLQPVLLNRCEHLDELPGVNGGATANWRRKCRFPRAPNLRGGGEQ